MKYKSYAQLGKDIWEWNKKLPSDIDLIVGIPRSGLLAASILALYRNVPLTDIDGFVKGDILKGGERCPIYENIRNVLIVDDSVRLGRAMSQAKNKLKKISTRYNLIFGAVYSDPGSKDMVDHFYELLPGNRVFQWNILHHCYLEGSCLDIDGVLCRDPSNEENDDGEKYIRFISNVNPLYRPKFPVGYLVTSRLEKYRKQTEAWLIKNGVKYHKLFMLDLPSKEERIRRKIHGKFKASIYNSLKADLFIESSRSQSIQILNLTGKCVYCIETMEMLYPSAKEILKGKWSRFLTLLKRHPKEACKKAFGWMLRSIRNNKIIL